MRNKKGVMKTMKYNVLFGFALVCAMLFTACPDINQTNQDEPQMSVETGYGRISINLIEDEVESQATAPNMAARTALPSKVFEKYVYTFTEPEMRTVTIDMYDQYGNGSWNEYQNALRINVNGVDIATDIRVQATVANNNPSGQRYTNSYTFQVTSGDFIELYWVAGVSQFSQFYQRYHSFIMYYADMPPSPAFYTGALSGSDVGPTEWSGNNALAYRLRDTMNNITNGTLLGSFTAVGKTSGVTKTPDNDGFFTLEVGNYNVEVQAFIGEADNLTLAARGVSSLFSVGPGNNDPVEVRLSEVGSEGEGEFDYSITYPLGAEAGITLQKWPGMNMVTLAPAIQGNKVTQTLNMEAGSYLLSVLIRKGDLYAGISEAIHINPLLTTTYTKTFDESDFHVGKFPVTSDYDISGTGTFIYDGTARTVSITQKANASPGAITILYNGSTIPPSAVGIYTVTFNVDLAAGWNAAAGLPAGTLSIKNTGAAVDAPTLSTRTQNSITVNAVTVPGNGQTVEYARATTTTAPTTGWQDSTTFTGLNVSTTYYIFARSKENTTYCAGEASYLQVMTLHNFTSVSANGSVNPKVKTTSLTLNFSGDPGTVTASNITLSGDAEIGSAMVFGSGNSRTLYPITLTKTGTGSVTVSVSHPDIVSASRTVTIYNPVTQGLHAVAPPVMGDDDLVDLSLVSGATIVDKSINYINAHPGTYTLVLGSDVSVAGHRAEAVTNGTAVRHLKVSNSKLTVIGIDEKRTISMDSYGAIFSVGQTGQTGIELTLGNNITLTGRPDGIIFNYMAVVEVQDAVFSMTDNASIFGNSYGGGVWVTGDDDIVNFTMQDNALVSCNDASIYTWGVNGGNITMRGNASITGSIGGSGGYITMSDSASVAARIGNLPGEIGGNDRDAISGEGREITMSGNASVNGRVYISSNSTFTMSGNTTVSNSDNDGVYVGSTSTFTMKESASVFNNNRGVYVSGGSFVMEDNAAVYNNSTTGNGGGVYVYSGIFEMKGGRVAGNKATGSTSYGGGVYVNGNGTFIMSGGVVYGLNEPSQELRNTAGSSGAALYVANGGSATYGNGYGTGSVITTPGIGIDSTIP